MQRLAHIVLLIIAMWSSGLGAPASYAGELFIVAHLPDREAILDNTELLKILRGKQRNWSSGFGARVALPSRDSDIYDEVSQVLFQSSGSMMQRNWFKLVFAGKANAPVYLDNDADVLEFVASQPGTVGVVISPFSIEQSDQIIVLKAAE
jgi:ABC-type phosphate transport system substrate-binding protein